MVTVVMFATARVAAGASTGEFAGNSVRDVLLVAREQYGPQFSSILDHSRVWLNGEAVDDMNATCAPGDELAILPPVAGG